MNIEPISISIAALIVSVVSAGASIFFGVRERARIKTSSVLYRGDEDHEPTIVISAVNVGRRPLIIRMWVGTNPAGEYAGTYVDGPNDGKRLGELERLEIRIRNTDLGLYVDELIEFSELWFEDTVGRRYRVKNSRKNIEEFWKNWKDLQEKAAQRKKLEKLVESQVRASLENARGGDGST